MFFPCRRENTGLRTREVDRAVAVGIHLVNHVLEFRL